MPSRAAKRIEAFDFAPGRILAGKYEVISYLGGGWEGEVYLVRERETGIERTAKFFYPQINIGDRASRVYANKLHRLASCPIVMQYRTHDHVRFQGEKISFLVSDYIDGELLSAFLARQPGRRLAPFPALHLLHALASGMECVHAAGEYHGDLHTDNVIVQRYGLGFDLKLVDVFVCKAPRQQSIQDDVVEMIRIFYESLGGARHYAAQPREVKAICLGLKRTLIRRKFRTAGKLRRHLETMEWD